MVEALLDTTFLLPTLGIEVGEITKRDFEILRQVLDAGTKLFCSHLSFVGMFGKIAKATKNQKVDNVVDEGTKSFVGVTELKRMVQKGAQTR